MRETEMRQDGTFTRHIMGADYHNNEKSSLTLFFLFFFLLIEILFL